MIPFKTSKTQIALKLIYSWYKFVLSSSFSSSLSKNAFSSFNNTNVSLYYLAILSRAAVEFALEKDYDHVFHKNAASSRELDSTSTFLILSR